MFRRMLFHTLRRRTPRTVVTLSLTTGGALALNASSNDQQPPLSSLFRAYLVYSFCSVPSLVDASPRILSALNAVPGLRHASDAFLKLTFFHQFVGAETVDDCVPLLHSLHRANQGALFSYSVEQRDSSSPDPSKQALQAILHSIDIAAKFPHSRPWVAVKLSTLLPDPSSLRLLSSAIISSNSHSIPFPGAPNTNNLPLLNHFQSLKSLHQSLRVICAHAQSHNINLTIDAEESWFQPAIDLFSLLLMQEFNSTHHHPLVYTTLQAYLTRAPLFLNHLINHAKSNNYSLGIKLVRGAYIDAERSSHTSPDGKPPTFSDKQSTDRSYDGCVRALIGEIAKDAVNETPRIAVLFGTHNWNSCTLVLDEIVKVGLGKQIGDKILLTDHVRKRVCMSQLYGMSDSLAAYLVDKTSLDQSPSSPFVIRYVPYGPLRDVMPYLARRAVENKAVFASSDENDLGGGAIVERKRTGKLIWERLVGFF